MATNVATMTDKDAVKAEITKVSSAVKKSFGDLGFLFIALCERFTGKDSQSGDNLAHLLNSLDGSKRFQAAIIARLNEYSVNTLAIDYDEEKQTYIVATKKGENKKSEFAKDKFIAAVAAAKANTEQSPLLPNKKEGASTEPKQRRFNPTKAQQKLAASLEDYAVNLMKSEGITPEILAVRLKSLVDEITLKVKPAIEGETA